MARIFFKNLYTREENTNPSIVMDPVQNCVNDEINERLCAPFTEKEISDAVFQIGPLKAP
jgi:hypothetical protein